MEIYLESGPRIYLFALIQYNVYEGMLEGLPTKEKNKCSIENAQKKAEEMWQEDSHLIVPPEITIEVDDYPFGTPASIPSVASLGRWRSDNEERGDDYGACELTLVWFQPNFGVPNDEVALQSIQRINWGKHAKFRIW